MSEANREKGRIRDENKRGHAVLVASIRILSSSFRSLLGLLPEYKLTSPHLAVSPHSRSTEDPTNLPITSPKS